MHMRFRPHSEVNLVFECPVADLLNGGGSYRTGSAHRRGRDCEGSLGVNNS